MILKCPKCRFSFEETVSPYVNELSCVCPRCGTPFTYSRPASDAPEISPEQAAGAVPSPNVSTAASERTEGQPHTNRSTAEEHPSPTPVQQDFQVQTHGQGRRKEHNDKYFYRLVAALVCSLAVVVVLIVFGVGRILNARNGSPVFDDTPQANESLVDTTALTVVDIDRIAPESVPEWIYGRWTGTTRYFEIELTISADGTIVEAEDGRSAQGTYIVNAGRLVCRFPENTTMVYRINESTKAIDAGDGIKLGKALSQ